MHPKRLQKPYRAVIMYLGLYMAKSAVILTAADFSFQDSSVLRDIPVGTHFSIHMSF
jgi:hypothetical protein